MEAARGGELLDLLIVGAGLSGIGAACHLQRECPDKRYAIVEARETIGGTWDLFRYPGVRSDSDMYTLGYDFKPWKDAKAIADGPAILRYIRETADEHGVTPHIRFGQRVAAADWDSRAALWRVRLKAAASGEEHTVEARFLYLCSGYFRYDRGHRPSFEGEADFRGSIVHPQFWPESLDWAGRRVVIVGSGATAVTLVPAMARGDAGAAHVTMLQRSPTYMVAMPSRDPVADRLRRWLPQQLAYRVIRWKNIALGRWFFHLARTRPEWFKAGLLRQAARQLPKGYDLHTHFTPRYQPWDQRLCLVPDGDLFKAIRLGRADIVTGEIERFTPGGIRLRTGEELPADLVVLATGLELDAPGDLRLSVDGQAIDPARQMAYKGMMLSDLPNLALTFGYTNASWTLKADLTARYVCRLLRHLDARGHAIAVPRRQADVQERPFLDFTSGYVQRALGRLPRQGDRAPWRVNQDYWADRRALRHGPVDDGVLRFGPAGMLPGASRVLPKL